MRMEARSRGASGSRPRAAPCFTRGVPGRGLMVCLVTGKKPAPPGNIVYNYVHGREDMHYGCNLVCSVNHVAGLVNSANDPLNHAQPNDKQPCLPLTIDSFLLMEHLVETKVVRRLKERFNLLICRRIWIREVTDDFLFFFLNRRTN